MDLKSKIHMTTSKEVENNHWKNPIFFHDKSAGESIARRNILQHNQDYIWQTHNNIILRKDMKQTFKVRKEEGLSTISIFHIVIKALAEVRWQGKKLKYINRKKRSQNSPNCRQYGIPKLSKKSMRKFLEIVNNFSKWQNTKSTT